MKHLYLTELLEFSHLHHIKKDSLRQQDSKPFSYFGEEPRNPLSSRTNYFFHVLEGEGIITAGAELYHVKAGHMIYVESNDICGIKWTERMNIICIQQPH